MSVRPHLSIPSLPIHLLVDWWDGIGRWRSALARYILQLSKQKLHQAQFQVNTYE